MKWLNNNAVTKYSLTEMLELMKALSLSVSCVRIMSSCLRTNYVIENLLQYLPLHLQYV